MDKKALAVIVTTIAITLPLTIVYGIVPIIQSFSYTKGTVGATISLPLGPIFATVPGSKTFTSAIQTNEYAGSLTITFKNPGATWETVFSECSITISLHGSTSAGIITFDDPLLTITVAANQEYDYFIEYTPLTTFDEGVNLDLEIS